MKTLLHATQNEISNSKIIFFEQDSYESGDYETDDYETDDFETDECNGRDV